MTEDSRLYCINTTLLTGSSNSYLDAGNGGYSTVPITPTLPALFGSSAELFSENLSTGNLFGMTPAFTGDIFNMPIERPNLDLCNQMFANIMTGFQQQMQNMQTPIMQQTSSMNPYSDEDTSYFSYDAKALKEKWSKAKPSKGAPPLTDGFYNKVVEISKRIGCDPNDLMGVMYSESRINSKSTNSIGATGLIQFIPSTAKSLGTTCDQLRNMSPEEQLVYVEKYLQRQKSKAKIPDGQKIGRGTLYALVFLPAFANRDVLTSQGEKYYTANKGLDVDKDGKITKSDLDKRVQNKICEATGTLA